jgi:hypothetical protein
VWLWLLIVLALIGGGVALAARGGDDATPAANDQTSRTDEPGRTDETQPPETGSVTVPVTVETTPVVTTPLTLPTTVPPTEPPTTDGPSSSDLEITEQWYYLSGENTFDYGGIIENHGTQTLTGFIEVQIDFFDATNRILSTESSFVDTVIPAVRTPFVGTLFDPAAEPVRMEVRLADDNFFDEAAGPIGDLTVANVTTADDGFEFDVNGDATSTFTVALDSVQLVALWRDPNGVVVFSATTYLDRVPAGSTSVFTVAAFSDVVPRTVPTEILFIA